MKYAYRAIAAFSRHVIDNPSSVINEQPFPDVQQDTDSVDSESEIDAGAMMPASLIASDTGPPWSLPSDSIQASADHLETFLSNPSSAKEHHKEKGNTLTNPGAINTEVRVWVQLFLSHS